MLRQALQVAVLACVVYLVFYFYINLGYNLHFKKHHPGECSHVSGLEYGSEDMEVTEDGLAFITSGVGFPSAPPGLHQFQQDNNIRGQIFLYDFTKPNLGARPLKIRPSSTFDPDTFQPGGISLLEDKVKGEHLLYVVNQVKWGKDHVEKFRFMPGVNELQHVRFFNDSRFLLTNDLAVLREDQFYISNFLYFDSGLLSTLEKLLPLKLGGLLFVDGDHVTEVLSNLHGPNGVTLSKNGAFLYVALPLDASMHVYERQKDNGLKLVQDVPEVHTVADNFQVTQAGDALLLGAHPIAHKIITHIGNPYERSPSSVLRLPLSNGRVVSEEITELFYDHGDLITASSVAQIHSNQLLIGSVLDKLVVCDLYGKVQGKGTGKK